MTSEPLQEQRWASLVARLSGHSFYGSRVHPSMTLGDIQTLPFTIKKDLWDSYPFGMLAIDRSELRRVHATSGTKGQPTIAAYSANDLEVFRLVNARSLAGAGAGPGTIVHNAYGYGLFTGGLGLHGGGERLGCAVVPISGGQTARQVSLIRDLRPEVLCCTPSYAALIGETMVADGITPEENPLRVGIFGAEPWSEHLRDRIEALHGIIALDIYGLCEIIGPGVACECLESREELRDGGLGGLHVNEDHFFPEIIDPETGQPVPEGETGELVLTTLTKEALPLIRYRTGDLTSSTARPCPCGRTTVRMGRLVGRSDDMVVVRGVNVFPSEIEQVVLDSNDLSPTYLIVLDTTGPMPEMTVALELASPGREEHDDHSHRQERARALSGGLTERLGHSRPRGGRASGGPPRTEVGKAVRLVRVAPEGDGRPPEIVALMEEG